MSSKESISSSVGELAIHSTEPENTKAHVVAVHGAWADARVFEWTARFLAERGIATHALDLPGHGQSGLPAGRSFNSLRVHDYVEAVRCAAGHVAESRDTPVSLMGHSLGAFALMKLMEGVDQEDAKDLRKIILLSPPGLNEILGLTLRYAMGSPVQFANFMAANASLDLARIMADKRIACDLLFSDSIRSEDIPEGVQGPESYLAYMDSLALDARKVALVREQIEKYRLQVHILTGGNDRIFSAGSIQRMAGAIGLSEEQVTVFKDAPHYLMMGEWYGRRNAPKVHDRLAEVLLAEDPSPEASTA